MNQAKSSPGKRRAHVSPYIAQPIAKPIDKTISQVKPSKITPGQAKASQVTSSDKANQDKTSKATPSQANTNPVHPSQDKPTESKSQISEVKSLDDYRDHSVAFPITQATDQYVTRDTAQRTGRSMAQR